MPEHEFYYYIDTNISSTCRYIPTSVADYFEQQMEKEYRKWQQEEEERINKEKEMKRYPLFFWRELCEPVLDLRTGKVI